MAGRQHPGLRPPELGDGNAVPRIRALGPWHRCVDRRHPQPWWFSTRTANNEAGRFDLEHPNGSCYLAASPVAAIVERIAEPDAEVPIRPTVGELEALSVWTGPLDGPPNVADTRVLSVPSLTGEIDTITPYGIPWAWADEFDACGAGGLLYRARFGRATALALFGPASSAEQAPTSAGQLADASALDFLTELPAALQPSAVGDRREFTDAPPPR